MKSVGLGIWIVDRPSQIPLFGDLGVRMTVVQLSPGHLMLISPVPLDDQLKGDLLRLGQVKFLVGPNSMHHLSLRRYHEVFPEAELAAPLKLQRKRSGLSFHWTLEDDGIYPWSQDLDVVLVDSKTSMSEAVFFHRASRTLILTDLMFNLRPPRKTSQKIAFFLNGVGKGPCMSRLTKFTFNDRVQLRKKAQAILKWNFQKIILAHGDIVETNAKQVFAEAFSWIDPGVEI